MNTTAAATEANVTVATIRTWCRIGAVAAAKVAGRWIIDTASLAARIAIGTRRKARMSEQATYRVIETTKLVYRDTRTIYRIECTDGTQVGLGPDKDHRLIDPDFFNRAEAEFYCHFIEETTSGYSLRKDRHSARFGSTGSFWVVTGSTAGDPKSLHITAAIDDNAPAGAPSPIDYLIRSVTEHAAGAPARITAKAEQDAIEAAEAAVREARETQLAEITRAKGPLATPKQVDFILTLLQARERSGDGGGFYQGPTDRAAIEEMTKGEASLYITSLKGEY